MSTVHRSDNPPNTSGPSTCYPHTCTASMRNQTARRSGLTYFVFCFFFILLFDLLILIQEAFEKCWAHSPLRAAARPFTRCRYCRTRASMSTTTTTTTTTNWPNVCECHAIIKGNLLLTYMFKYVRCVCVFFLFPLFSFLWCRLSSRHFMHCLFLLFTVRLLCHIYINQSINQSTSQPAVGVTPRHPLRPDAMIDAINPQQNDTNNTIFAY